MALERELSLIQTRLHHLVKLIANGRGTGSVIDSLHQEEARKKTLLGELDQLDHFAHVVSLDTKRLAKDLRSRLEDPFLPSSLETCHRPARCSGGCWTGISSVSRLRRRGSEDTPLPQLGHSTAY